MFTQHSYKYMWLEYWQSSLSPLRLRRGTTQSFQQLPERTLAGHHHSQQPLRPPQHIPLMPISSIWPPFCGPFARDAESFSRVGGSDLLWLNCRPCSPSAFRRRRVPCARSPVEVIDGQIIYCLKFKKICNL